ncbi:MAG: Membrane protein [Myxococcaceae bacterium]|nr:Membrane protein [Myxococcaceae bacterium]
MYLGIAEVVSMPMSILLNAMIGRYMGPAEVGHIYLATTIAGLAFLLVSWGHSGSMPAAVVADTASAGQYLGSSLAWRAVTSVLAYATVALGCRLLGFTGPQQWAIGLVFLASTFGTMLAACQDAIRGFERTDIAAYARVGVQFASTFLVLPVLVLGGGMRFALSMQALAVLLVLIAVQRVLGRVGIGKLGWDWPRLKKLVVQGTPFALFGLALVLQPNVDAFYLAKLTSSEVVGWYSVSRKLLGVLVVPATALIGALYPTLCRLFVTDQAGFQRTTRDSIATVSLLVVPMVLGCALYPDVGVSIFGRAAFQPAEDDLRFSSPYLFLLYFSMPVGCALVAAGRQKLWTAIQLGSVVSNAVLDPFLIRYFQDRHGNGGLGLCVAGAVSEALLVAAGLAIMPRGVFDRGLAKTLSLAVLSGGAMAATAFALRALLPPLVAAPISGLAYGAVLYMSGAISPEQLGALTGLVQRRLRRNKPAVP